MAKAVPTEVKIVLACGALLWDLWQAARHQRTCPQCAGRRQRRRDEPVTMTSPAARAREHTGWRLRRR